MFLLSLLLDAEYARLRVRLALMLYVAILVIGSIPGARAEAAEVASGLVLHFVAYSCIAFLLFSGFAGTARGKSALVILTVAAMGALDEYVQSFFPYRTASVGDWAVDVSAAVFTCVMASIMLPRIKRGI